MAPQHLLDEDASLEERLVPSSCDLCPQSPFDGGFWGASSYGSSREARTHTDCGPSPFSLHLK